MEQVFVNEQILWKKYLTRGNGTNSWPRAMEQTVHQWIRNKYGTGISKP